MFASFINLEFLYSVILINRFKMAKERARAASKKDEIESPVIKVKRSKSNQGKIMPNISNYSKF